MSIVRKGVKAHIAAVAPTVNDDETTGINKGDIWIDEVLDKVYIVTNVTAAAADWKLVSNV